MKKKTAMQQLIDYLYNGSLLTPSIDDIILKAEELQKLEREQIQKAWVDGGKMISDVDAKNSVDYYQKTYNQS